MSGAKNRILMIDDDADLTRTVGDALEAHGYSASVANCGEHGLELAYTQHPHLILLDVMMPGMDGYQVCRELQFGYTKDIPVVFLTAKTELANMMEANRSGASAYVTKPFRIERLLQTIHDVLRDAAVYRDEITGLPTFASVQVELQRRLLDHTQLGILYVTVDGVHALEQQRGFEVVDDIFRLLGKELTETRGRLIRTEDFVSVSSLGDAFLVVLAPARDQGFVDDDDLRQVKERLEQELLDFLEGKLDSELQGHVDLYVGYSRLSQSPKIRFKRALLKAIDHAMRGIQQERSELQHRLSTEFERVISQAQITCVFQPIIDLSDYAVIGYELLARGPIQSELHRPDALFEVARAENRVPELDRLCRLVAARGGATLPPEYLRFINTEPIDLLSRSRGEMRVQEFIDATPEALRSQTVMEITENSVIDDFAHMRHVIDRLRDRGFRIAIDDAGAGYAGLQTMVELEPDFIKLDMSLTRHLDKSIVKQKLIGTLRDFCSQAGIGLVAEGIETQAQLDTLLALGITYAQGFLFARPGSPYPLRETILPGAPTGSVRAPDDPSGT